MAEALQIASNGLVHVRGECPKCRSWVQWIPYRDSEHCKNILKLFYNGNFKALEELQKIAIYDYKKKEIK